MIPITASSAMYGAKVSLASGNSGRLNRTKPYVPIFSITPARMTEPAVGACTCASGSHECSGHIGTFTANAMANARNSQRSVFMPIFSSPLLICAKRSEEHTSELQSRPHLVCRLLLEKKKKQKKKNIAKRTRHNNT